MWPVQMKSPVVNNHLSHLDLHILDKKWAFMKTLWHGNALYSSGLLWGNSHLDSRHNGPVMGSSDVCFVVSLNRLLTRKQLPVIWDGLTLRWRHSKCWIPQYRRPPVEYMVLRVKVKFAHSLLRCGWLWVGHNLCLLWDYLCLLYP